MKPENTIEPRANAAGPALEVNIWPNPARDMLMVSLNNFEANKKLEMVLMQVGWQGSCHPKPYSGSKGHEVRFDVGAMSAGYYLM
jgi:hypothetical protein